MSNKDDQYMHEINRLEGERDYWKRRCIEMGKKNLTEVDLREVVELSMI